MQFILFLWRIKMGNYKKTTKIHKKVHTKALYLNLLKFTNCPFQFNLKPGLFLINFVYKKPGQKMGNFWLLNDFPRWFWYKGRICTVKSTYKIHSTFLASNKYSDRFKSWKLCKPYLYNGRNQVRNLDLHLKYV